MWLELLAVARCIFSHKRGFAGAAYAVWSAVAADHGDLHWAVTTLSVMVLEYIDERSLPATIALTTATHAAVRHTFETVHAGALLIATASAAQWLRQLSTMGSKMKPGQPGSWYGAPFRAPWR